MMDWTDRHCRYFHRLLSPSALLYTEMVTTGAIIHGDDDRFLDYNPEEKLESLGQFVEHIPWISRRGSSQRTEKSREERSETGNY